MLLFTQCTGVRSIPEGEYFYDGSQLNIDRGHLKGKEKAMLVDELQQQIPYSPNRRIFGSRPGVWFYSLFKNPTKDQTIRYYVKHTLGASPVLLGSLNADAVKGSIQSYLKKKGYLQSEVAGEIQLNKERRTGSLSYDIDLGDRYRIRSVTFADVFGEGGPLNVEGLERGSLLSPGQPFDTDALKEETSRAAEIIRNAGYHYFKRQFLFFEADTTVGNREVELEMCLRDSVSNAVLRPYKISAVSVFQNNSPLEHIQRMPTDTIFFGGISHIYADSKSANIVDAKTLNNLISVRPQAMFSSDADELTLKHLIEVGVFSFANISYKTTADSTLDARIELIPGMKKTLRSEANIVSKSNGSIGPVVAVTFRNRNVFGGAENLDLSVAVSYETQLSSKETGTLNALELKFKMNLLVNRFLQPFKFDYHTKQFLPKTIFKGEANFHNRINYYNINGFSASFGYSWQSSAAVHHELFPIDLSYISTDNIGPEVIELFETNPSLEKSLEDQFIVGAHYGYMYTNERRESLVGKSPFQPHVFYFKGSVETAGNLLQQIIREKGTGSEQKTILSVPFSQYFKGDVDVRYHWRPTENNTIASHASFGAGYAYGNSEVLPFVKQYSIGGPGSLRAFRARTVGPGSYDVMMDAAYQNDSISFTDQYAEIRIESNIEYRFNIYEKINGAVFVDAGNIWTFRPDSTRAGAQFDIKTFYRQLAVGSGVGLRFDFGFFLLRFDLAIPLRKTNGWVLDEIDVNSSTWRKENIILNIAIGYPF